MTAIVAGLLPTLFSYAGIGLMGFGIMLPLLRPHLFTAWAIAIGLAAAGALCMGVSVRLLDDG